MMDSQKLWFASKVRHLEVAFDRNLTFVPHPKKRKAVAKKRLRQLYCLTKKDSGMSNARRYQLVKSTAVPTAIYKQETRSLSTISAEEPKRKHKSLVPLESQKRRRIPSPMASSTSMTIC